CLSASHIAFGSIRMEPVFMVLGQSAATAAMQAIKSDVPVQAIDYDALKEKLLADGQVLAWSAPVGISTAARAIEVRTLKVAAFQVDVTPPLGSPLCNGAVKPAMEIVTPLTARGIVLLGADQPIVLCAFDWVGIANESHDRFREALAEAVGTTTERVALHTLHQHDAPGSDFATERLLAEHGLERRYSNADFDADVMRRIAEAAKTALGTARPVTHIGLGTGRVEQVASNRRILGPDGKVVLQRQSSGGRNPAAREAPEGTIDPLVRLITFWHNKHPCAVLTYYATHPQSYYGQGSVNWDFVGMARELREKSLPGVPLIHFDGAGGNVAAGKYNDGSRETRPVLAQRLADGMQQAWESQTKQPISAAHVSWQVVPVAMPVRDTLVENKLMAKLDDPGAKEADRLRAARDLTFLRRTLGGHRIPITCLSLGTARVLHMPGELFVEYQLAAQKMSPDNFVVMAAYGDYGPGYIGTSIAYTQGGYETGIVSRVGPEVEQVLTGAMKTLLRADADVD
ncbi:MAG: FAD-dependent oxidoreductase, partial [Planctomycetaceae bacterium]|nr:FAD-dependent oxidoreductase [Planctomycetaceae bacterium]